MCLYFELFGCIVVDVDSIEKMLMLDFVVNSGMKGGDVEVVLEEYYWFELCGIFDYCDIYFKWKLWVYFEC